MSVLEDGRALAESLMVDSCEIGTVGRVWDEATASYTETFEAVYSGPCKLKQENVQANNGTQQGRMVVAQSLVLSLPVATSGGVLKDMTVRMTACVNDAAVVGRRYRVVAFPASSFATARRLTVEEVQ